MGRKREALAAREHVTLRIAAQHRELVTWASGRSDVPEGRFIRRSTLATALEALAGVLELRGGPHSELSHAWADAKRVGIDADEFLGDVATTEAVLEALAWLVEEERADRWRGVES